MTQTDREDLLAKLDAGHADLLDAVAGMTDEEARHAAEGQWSAIDNIEHLTLAEANLMRGIESSQPQAAAAAAGREDFLFANVKLRRRKATAPEATRPTGTIQTLAEALARFDEVRSRTVAFVQSCPHDLRLCPTTHPLIGPLTSLECLNLIAAHPFRHAAQIRESRG